MRLELITLRSRVACSTDSASRVPLYCATLKVHKYIKESCEESSVKTKNQMPSLFLSSGADFPIFSLQGTLTPGMIWVLKECSSWQYTALDSSERCGEESVFTGVSSRNHTETELDNAQPFQPLHTQQSEAPLCSVQFRCRGGGRYWCPGKPSDCCRRHEESAVSQTVISEIVGKYRSCLV